MNPFTSLFVGLSAGVLVGLLVSWGYLSGWYLVISAGVILIGSFAPTPLRGLFIFSLLGFVIAFVVSGGLEVIGV